MAAASSGRVWMITGAGRGLGLAIAKAALAAGCRVAATARAVDAVREALGGDETRVLALPLDVTDADQAEAAVAEILRRFGTVDVLVNSAGYGQMGPFEANSAEDVARQFDVNVFGLMNVTRAVLPAMRKQGYGHVFNFSSIAGVRGRAGGSLYAASKFAVSGFTEGLALELKPLGIFATVVEPGYFRTDFLDASSMRFGDAKLDDYAEVMAAMKDGYNARNHKQPGDPAKLAQALLVLAESSDPPVHFAVGSDAVTIVETKLAAWGAELAKWQALSSGTDGDFEDAAPPPGR
jgi:NAD(P)-dependent dehydrogenase (short-subunit alcohol dehydrogenase family)